MRFAHFPLIDRFAISAPLVWFGIPSLIRRISKMESVLSKEDTHTIAELLF